ncbi:hypothetical protein GCM10011578_072060 [Streptomyces fuscichromogenes]|uniref:Uncharacterized protein n=1 Tax=Streptomyces fuscichromogenes TaxID=1324013 RepID=A0A917XJJ1_9ACTN|nr:hypothetical protein GCM10011578_072060 [Streptomyces fuscichromogenes]
MWLPCHLDDKARTLGPIRPAIRVRRLANLTRGFREAPPVTAFAGDGLRRGTGPGDGSAAGPLTPAADGGGARNRREPSCVEEGGHRTPVETRAG